MSGPGGGKSVQSSPDGVVLELRVIPRASRSELLAAEGGLRLRLAAPPVEGAANEELIHYLAKIFSLRKSDVVILSGMRGRNKRVLLRGLDNEAVIEIIERVT
jgi:uncharacterized protein (TIGR00251 family)